MRAPGVGCLLTATSANGIDLEKLFLGAARRLGVPALAVLDFWSNYRQRFSDQRDNLIYLPDRIAVMDEHARTEMIAEGFAPELLSVTGQPAFDALEPAQQRFTPDARAAVRAQLGGMARTNGSCSLRRSPWPRFERLLRNFLTRATPSTLYSPLSSRPWSGWPGATMKKSPS